MLTQLARIQWNAVFQQMFECSLCTGNHDRGEGDVKMHQKESFPLRNPHFAEAGLVELQGASVISDVIKMQTKVLRGVDGC